MVDLHTHSYYSDGSCSPAQLLSMAEAAGLSALALCDHNTVAGLPEFIEAGKDSPVEAVPGVELSTEYQGTELHILGLFLQPAHFEAVNALMEDFCSRKERSNRALAQALRQAGLDIDYDAVRAGANGFVNRAHFAAELTRKGYTASPQEAFQKYLSPKRGLYTPPQRLDAYDAIAFIKSLGAVAVLAHPFLNLDGQRLRAFLPEALERGLDGMEVLYPKYDAGTTAMAEQLAKEFGLLPSGGSDFHGQAKPDIRIGVGRGELQVPQAFLQALRERRKPVKNS